MKFKEWKAGDEAFLVGFGWVILESDDSILYPLRFRAHAFTKDGKNWTHDRYPSLLDHNPFDKSDPKNPKEEARKTYGSSVQMIPGTEREVEG